MSVLAVSSINNSSKSMPLSPKPKNIQIFGALQRSLDAVYPNNSKIVEWSREIAEFGELFLSVTNFFKSNRSKTANILPQTILSHNQISKRLWGFVRMYAMTLSARVRGSNSGNSFVPVHTINTVTARETRTFICLLGALQNCVSWEFARTRKMFSTAIGVTDLHDLLEGTLSVFCARVVQWSPGDSRKCEPREEEEGRLRGFLIQFWNSVTNWNVFAKEAVDGILHVVASHTALSAILVHLTSTVRHFDNISLEFMEKLSKCPEFLSKLGRDDFEVQCVANFTAILETSSGILRQTQYEAHFTAYLLRLIRLIHTLCSSPALRWRFLTSPKVTDALREFVGVSGARLCGTERMPVMDRRVLLSALVTLYSALHDQTCALSSLMLTAPSDGRPPLAVEMCALGRLSLLTECDLRPEVLIKFHELTTLMGREIDPKAYAGSLRQGTKAPKNFVRIRKNVYVCSPPVYPSDGEDCPMSGSHTASSSPSTSVPVTPFPTGDSRRGFGLRLAGRARISPGRCLVPYLGEVLTVAEFGRDARRQARALKCCYVVFLDGNHVIDASLTGGLSRFINHSCNPNCQLERRLNGTEVIVEVFAKKPISPGEELTLDYAEDFVGGQLEKCACAANNCSGTINYLPLVDPDDVPVLQDTPTTSCPPNPCMSASILPVSGDMDRLQSGSKTSNVSKSSNISAGSDLSNTSNSETTHIIGSKRQVSNPEESNHRDVKRSRLVPNLAEYLDGTIHISKPSRNDQHCEACTRGFRVYVRACTWGFQVYVGACTWGFRVYFGSCTWGFRVYVGPDEFEHWEVSVAVCGGDGSALSTKFQECCVPSRRTTWCPASRT
eukprot:912583_1